MTTTAKQLLDQAMTLDNDDRAELIDRLADSLEAGTDSDYLRAWETEIADRLARIDSGQAKMIPAEESIRRLREKVKANGQAG
jgi:putative addiction module component (TIGR02574 family)